MARKFEELMKKMTPARRARVEARATKEIEAIELEAVRLSRKLTQTQMAKKMGVGQGSISRLEKQKDIRLSTLRSYVEAMGARLEIRAVFPDARPAMKIGK